MIFTMIACLQIQGSNDCLVYLNGIRNYNKRGSVNSKTSFLGAVLNKIVRLRVIHRQIKSGVVKAKAKKEEAASNLMKYFDTNILILSF
ncbi:hypothetical protein BpHYR1_047300 [Brachionus plicatilis]|uniref:Uncharacterized protein n=1 Tax=Brachionus plicatilis TaxID=10195 RepID=A0A3M7T0D3_BRAPC|nr:hypothetical protein BpHYR1_047300 [Brachionus plicatilis]